MIDWSALPGRVNADPEFRLSSRFWTATLRLDVGARSHALRFEDGELSAVSESSSEAEADVFIRAPQETWDELLRPTPRPFYQDLAGARIHHGVELPDDMTTYAAYYPALRRLVQLLSAARQESGS